MRVTALLLPLLAAAACSAPRQEPDAPPSPLTGAIELRERPAGESASPVPVAPGSHLAHLDRSSRLEIEFDLRRLQEIAWGLPGAAGPRLQLPEATRAAEQRAQELTRLAQAYLDQLQEAAAVAAAGAGSPQLLQMLRERAGALAAMRAAASAALQARAAPDAEQQRFAPEAPLDLDAYAAVLAEEVAVLEAGAQALQEQAAAGARVGLRLRGWLDKNSEAEDINLHLPGYDGFPEGEGVHVPAFAPLLHPSDRQLLEERFQALEGLAEALQGLHAGPRSAQAAAAARGEAQAALSAAIAALQGASQPALRARLPALQRLAGPLETSEQEDPLGGTLAARELGQDAADPLLALQQDAAAAGETALAAALERLQCARLALYDARRSLRLRAALFRIEPEGPQPLEEVPPTDLRPRTYPVATGDRLHLQAELVALDGPPEPSWPSWREQLQIDDFGLKSSVDASLVFVNRINEPGASQRVQFEPAPSATWSVHYRKRQDTSDADSWAEAWNFIDPGIGVHVAALSFEESGSEVGVGVQASVFGNLLQIGYGYNLNVDRDHGYFFLGIGLVDALNLASVGFSNATGL